MRTATRSIDSTYSFDSTPRYMSMEEALSHGVTLEESKRRLEKLIYDHYHPKQ